MTVGVGLGVAAPSVTQPIRFSPEKRVGIVRNPTESALSALIFGGFRHGVRDPLLYDPFTD